MTIVSKNRYAYVGRTESAQGRGTSAAVYAAAVKWILLSYRLLPKIVRSKMTGRFCINTYWIGIYISRCFSEMRLQFQTEEILVSEDGS